MEFLPISRADMEARGWDELDIIIISGDAYVDHPAWAAALLGRFMEARGYRIGIIAQPSWRDLTDITRLGQPRLFFAISGGNLDSMVSHYTADKKRRREDLYSPGGQVGLRPERPTIVYSNLVRQAYPGVPIVIGGVEASLRRLAHYDYWSDQVRRSILVDSRADLLVYGMGEYQLLEIANRLRAGQEIAYLPNLRGTCYLADRLPGAVVEIPSFEAVAADKTAFVAATRVMQENINPYCAQPLGQQHAGRWVVQNPPALPLTTGQMDEIYDLPYLRRSHPVYDLQGGVPGLAPVQFSIVTHRGCFGGCSFCSLGMHQGKFIQDRSPRSILQEATAMVDHPYFKGTIPDVGAPSANMYGLKGKDEEVCHLCRRTSCLHPGICKNLATDHIPSVRLWHRLRGVPGLKHIFVASGLRYDLLLQDRSPYLRDLCRHHIGGQLKIAPEHISDRVTDLMNKPGKSEYKKFIDKFKRVNQELGKDQYLVPYFISAHPGCTLTDNLQLAEFIRDQLQYYPEQVQNFTPTPMTVSTCMYYTGIDPSSGEPVQVPSQVRERRLQRALLQYRNRANYSLVREALAICHREDLIGAGPKALVSAPAGQGNKLGRQPDSKAKSEKTPSSGRPKKPRGSQVVSGGYKGQPQEKSAADQNRPKTKQADSRVVPGETRKGQRVGSRAETGEIRKDKKAGGPATTGKGHRSTPERRSEAVPKRRKGQLNVGRAESGEIRNDQQAGGPIIVGTSRPARPVSRLGVPSRNKSGSEDAAAQLKANRYGSTDSFKKKSKPDGSRSDGPAKQKSKPDGSRSEGPAKRTSKTDRSRSESPAKPKSKTDRSRSEGLPTQKSKPDGSRSEGPAKRASKTAGSLSEGGVQQQSKVRSRSEDPIKSLSKTDSSRKGKKYKG